MDNFILLFLILRLTEYVLLVFNVVFQCSDVCVVSIYLYSYYRIEFHHKHLKYFCELDGLILYGEDKFDLYFPNYNIPMSSFPKLHLKDITNKQINVNSGAEDHVDDAQTYFEFLPVSIIYFHILKEYLNCSKLSLFCVFHDNQN